MSDIFISYASVDRERARQLAGVLANEGWSVWWDRTIPPGRTFDQVIEQALQAARCVVVLWSRASSSSEWVKTEAAEGARKGILIPAFIEKVVIPLEFRRVQAADLSDWQGAPDHPELLTFLRSIRDLVEAGQTEPGVPAWNDGGSGRAMAPRVDPGVEQRVRPRSGVMVGGKSAWTSVRIALIAGLLGLLMLGGFVVVRLINSQNGAAINQGERRTTAEGGGARPPSDAPPSRSILAAPAPVEPACGSVIPADQPMALVWRPVDGASTYSVEMDCLGCEGSQSGWSSQSGSPWHVRQHLGLRSPIYNTSDIHPRIRQSRARAVRWRVWAVDPDGRDGEKSAWCQIAFVGSPPRPRP